MAKEDVKNLEKALDDDERIELFFSKHWKKVLGAAVVILLAGVVAYSIYYTNKKNTEKATLELASAKAENLPALLEKHSDVPGAAFARLRLAHYQFGKKQYEEAAGNFLAFANDASTPKELGIHARFSAGACKEYAGKSNEALTIYRSVYDDQVAGLAARNEAAFQLGRLYLSMDKKDEAKNILKSVAEAELINNPADPGVAAGMQWQGMCKALYESID